MGAWRCDEMVSCVASTLDLRVRIASPSFNINSTEKSMVYPYKRVRVGGKLIDRHRLVMEKKLGRKLESWELVHHMDEDKSNDHPDNLELTTRPDHAKHHMSQEFREYAVRGIAHHKAKLTEAEVVEIRRRLNAGEKGTHLAWEYGVHHTLIYQIKSRKIWTHI